MIYKNAQIGIAKNITLIELGDGDVQVGCVPDKYVGIAFINDESNPIGTSHNTAGTTTDDGQPQAMLTFSNIESLEIVEEALRKAKILLRNV